MYYSILFCILILNYDVCMYVSMTIFIKYYIDLLYVMCDYCTNTYTIHIDICTQLIDHDFYLDTDSQITRSHGHTSA